MVKRDSNPSSSSIKSAASSATSRRPSILLSPEALQHVVHPKSKAKKKKNLSQHAQADIDDEEEDAHTQRRHDALGDYLAKALNTHPEFSYNKDQEAVRLAAVEHHDQEGFILSPILSKRNWKWLQRTIHKVRFVRPSLALILTVIGFCHEKAPSWTRLRSSVTLFLGLLTAGLVVVICTSHTVIVWSVHEICLLTVQFSLFLLDWNEVEKNCPTMLLSLLNTIISWSRWIDQKMLLQKEYAGREWNQDDFDFSDSPQKAASRNMDLWTLPPPCIADVGAKLCIDPRYISRKEWSPSTSQHIAAIDFCYIMMKEEHCRKRARRSTMFQSQPHRVQSDYNGSRNKAVTTQQQVMSISAELDEHTEQIVGLQSTSPTSGGIELVRENEGSPQKLVKRDMALQHIDALDRNGNFDYDGGNGDGKLGDTGLGLIAETPMHFIKSDDSDSCRSLPGSDSSACVAEMNWVDISAKIGMRVLNSAHLQRVVASQETTERIKGITEQFGVASPRDGKNGTMVFDFVSPGDTSRSSMSTGDYQRDNNGFLQNMSRSLKRPKHSMWTSAAAARTIKEDDSSSISDTDADWEDSKSPGNDVTITNSTDNDLSIPELPPKIIRTRNFPSQSPTNHQSFVPSLREKEEQFEEQIATERRGKSKLLQTSMSTEGEAYEIVAPGCRTYESSTAESVLPANGGDVKNRNARSFSYSLGDSHATEKAVCKREALSPGVKVAVPIFPLQPGTMSSALSNNFQMATVVASKRICVSDGNTISSPIYTTNKNCLSVTCKMDKSFLRNGEFAEVTFRVMDKWSSRYMPKHSKVPIGACVATSFGIGVVVGWRVEDDCHIVRSLWQRRGAGAAHAYLNRSAIHGVVEAAVGFHVMTRCGSASVLGYVDGGPKFLDGRYTVCLKDDGIYKNCEVSLPRKDVYSCYGAQFIPVIEYIKEACDFEIMLDDYNSFLRQQKLSHAEEETEEEKLWKFWSENLDIIWKSFLKAVEEDSEFDEGVDYFMNNIIDFLERLDRPTSGPGNGAAEETEDSSSNLNSLPIRDDTSKADSSCGDSTEMEDDDHENHAGFWIMNDIFGGIFARPGDGKSRSETSKETSTNGHCTEEKKCDDQHLPVDESTFLDVYYKRAFAIVHTLMRTVSLARAASSGKPRLRLALTIWREFLMFVKTLIKVQQRNVSPQSLIVWRTSLAEIKSTFGPIKERLEKVGKGIARRMEQQGRKAKIKVLRFADSILLDEVFLNCLCQGEWEQCLLRIEYSLVKAKIMDEASCVHYRKTVRFLYEHIEVLSSKDCDAAERNNEKMAKVAQLIQLLASPKRSVLKLLRSDDVLEILERILVRVFCREKEMSRMLSIHASNFKSLRHLRILKNLPVAGRMWVPLLDAADEELSYVVSQMPENAKEFIRPLSSIFSLCVAQFHKIAAGNSTKDWLDFLLEEDGVRIIRDIDMKAIQALSSFSRDVKDTMVVLPYYPSLDDDILKLMDEVELDKFLKEASEAIDDADKLADFIRDKASSAIERFLVSCFYYCLPARTNDCVIQIGVLINIVFCGVYFRNTYQSFRFRSSGEI